MGRLEPGSVVDELEDLLNEKWCHSIAEDGRLVCGCGGWICHPDEYDHIGRWDTDRCEGCGRRNCPDCRDTMERIR